MDSESPSSSESKKVHLPQYSAILQGSLRSDGSRILLHPEAAKGPFARARNIVFLLLIAIWLAMPIVRLNGHPLVLLDVPNRIFYLFGGSFNAQDIWLLFFVLAGTGFGLAYATAFFGRVWCGWACPQTVFMEAIFRTIESWIEGPRRSRMLLDRSPMTPQKVFKKFAKHAAFIATAIFCSSVFVAYFIGVSGTISFFRQGVRAHWETAIWLTSLAAIFYLNFAFFREQMCLVICPYGRLQSLLVDDHTITVAYDEKRGEPRRQKGETVKRGAAPEKKGDCIDCGQCVNVCPTGIDIRNGMQLDCIACTACIDACDVVMTKMHRPKGLIRYDSLAGIRGEPKKVLRPRLYIYSAICALLVVGTVAANRSRIDFEANVLRLSGAPFAIDNDVVRNGFEIHLVNKRNEPATFEIVPVLEGDMHVVVAQKTLTLGAMKSARVPLFVMVPLADHRADFSMRVRIVSQTADKTVTAMVLGPN
jgi:cytochrome c oxidase accessory protein FixG